MSNENNVGEWVYDKPAPKGAIVEIEITWSPELDEKVIPLSHMGYRQRAKRVKVDFYRIDNYKNMETGEIGSIEVPSKNVVRWRAIDVKKD